MQFEVIDLVASHGVTALVMLGLGFAIGINMAGEDATRWRDEKIRVLENRLQAAKNALNGYKDGGD